MQPINGDGKVNMGRPYLSVGFYSIEEQAASYVFWQDGRWPTEL